MKSRDEAEKALSVTVEETTRTYLQRVLDSVTTAIQSGQNDAQPVLALGVMLGWWTDAVGEQIVESIKESWQAAFGATASGTVTARADAMAFHLAAVRDRLSRSALPDLPQAAFDQVRLSQSIAALKGWGTKEQSRDIAERLNWEPNKDYWKQVQFEAETAIDLILDPLGKPGDPARTYAHKNDPKVKFWQSIRAQAVDRIKEDESEWQVRSTRIARTEATAAWNSGALAALAAEGRTHKKWLATTKGRSAERTRHSHLEANGQVVPISRPFRVGSSLLMMPGDPSGPAHEVINCRCTVIGADEPKTLTAAGSFNPHQKRVPAGNTLGGQWMDAGVLSGLVKSFIRSWQSQMTPSENGLPDPPGDVVGFLHGGVGSSPRHVDFQGVGYVLKHPRTGEIGGMREAAGAAVAAALGFPVAAETAKIPFYHLGEIAGENTIVTMPHVGMLDGFDWSKKWVGSRYDAWKNAGKDGQSLDAEGRIEKMTVPGKVGGSFRMAVLDMLLANSDRGSGNWRVEFGPGGPEDQPVALPIDMEGIDLDREYDTFKKLRKRSWGDFVGWWFPTDKFNYALPTDDELEDAAKDIPAIRKAIEGLDPVAVTPDQIDRMLRRLELVQDWLDDVSVMGLENWLEVHGNDD